MVACTKTLGWSVSLCVLQLLRCDSCFKIFVSSLQMQFMRCGTGVGLVQSGCCLHINEWMGGDLVCVVFLRRKRNLAGRWGVKKKPVCAFRSVANCAKTFRMLRFLRVFNVLFFFSSCVVAFVCNFSLCLPGVSNVYASSWFLLHHSMHLMHPGFSFRLLSISGYVAFLPIHDFVACPNVQRNAKIHSHLWDQQRG